MRYTRESRFCKRVDRCFPWLLAVGLFIASLLMLRASLQAQTCTNTFTLRQTSCPAGVTSCVNKGSVLTRAELDADLLNALQLCNGPGKFTWPNTGAAGIFAVSSGGTVSIATDDDVPDAGDFGALALTGDVMSLGLSTTIQPNSVGLATDTTGNYAAGDAEAGNATGLACTTCVDATDVASDAITEPKLKFVDSPSDEECLTYESTVGDFEWQTCGSGGGATDTLTVSTMTDDFLGGATEAGELGEKGWTGTGTVAYQAPEANHPGIVRFTTAATNGTAQYMHPATVTTLQWITTDVSEVRVVFRLGAVTNIHFNCGLNADHTNTASGGAESVRLNLDTSVSSNFRTITRLSSTTATTSSVAAVANTWYYLRLVRNVSGNWEFYLNGTLIQTHTTTLPTGGLGFSCNATPLENVAKTWDLDYIQVTSKTFTQRH